MANFGIFFSIITSIIFWGVVLVTFVRICSQAGLRLPQTVNRCFIEKITPVYCQIASFVVRDEVKVILFGAMIRLFILILAFLTLLAANGPPLTFTALFYAFSGGDVQHYLTLVDIGYSWETPDGKNVLLAFFPLYVFLVRGVNVFLNNTLASAFVVTFLSYLIGLHYIFRLVRLDFDRKIAWWTVILISVAPPAFFFGVPMTESLMLLTSAMTLYYIRTHKWPLAGIAGALCLFTRMVGAILIVVAAVEFIVHYKIFALIQSSEWKEVFRLIGKKGLWILVMLVGGLAYLYLNWHVSGNPFQFLYYQRTHWSNVSQYFGQTISDQFRLIYSQYITAVSTIFLSNVVAFAFAIFLLAYACIKRLQVTYIVYTLGYVFISFSPSWLLSGARYVVVCIPLFIFLAHAIRKNSTFKALTLSVFLVGLIWLTRAFLVRGLVF